MTIRRILCPIDGSPGSRRALERALTLASAVGAVVTVLQVIEDEGPLPTYSDLPPPGADRLEWLAGQRYEPVRDALDGTAVKWTRRIEQGNAPGVICDVATEEGSDLVVIGCRGLSAAGRFLLGSGSDRVVHHAPCSVMVTR